MSSFWLFAENNQKEYMMSLSATNKHSQTARQRYLVVRMRNTKKKARLGRECTKYYEHRDMDYAAQRRFAGG